MIVLVDDDPALIEAVMAWLKEDGHEVEGFTDPKQALERILTVEPTLIISDVRMPVMDGFELRRAYQERCSHRNTPFMFLSSLQDAETIVNALDHGAEDFLTKPVLPAVLTAKVRALVRRTQQARSDVFYGDLSKMPFANLLKFCERRALSGELEVIASSIHVRIPFRAGELISDDTIEEALADLFELTEGMFVITSRTVSFDDLKRSARSSPAAPSRQHKPNGMLSAVTIEHRTFQVQTEVTLKPTSNIVTIVVLDGRTLFKRTKPLPPTLSQREAVVLVRQQHQSVEQEVQHKLASLKVDKAVDTDKVRMGKLMDEGFERFRSKDFAGAIAAWQAALDIDPGNGTLKVNLHVARRKLHETSADEP